MTAPNVLLGVLLGLAGAGGGIGFLRASWAHRGGGAGLGLGWTLLIAAAGGWRATGAGWDKAVGLAVLAAGLVGLAVVAAGVELPQQTAVSRRREPREAESPATSRPPWRAWVRVACAGPLALAAAVACGAWMALRGPGSEADRLVVAGFLTPTVWAAGGVWATTDDRLGRVALALALTAAVAVATARP